mgnify:CR=1 FL=1
MPLTRINAVNAISGTIPAAHVDNTTVANITALPSAVETGALTLISTHTASDDASVSITSGIDSTYDSYVFKFIDIHPETDNSSFQFQCSTDSGSTYGVTVTTTYFRAQHNESDSNTSLTYLTTDDLAQSTSFITISEDVGADNDQAVSGTLQLFQPSSTTFVKHFINNFSGNQFNNFSFNEFMAGYFNDTNDIDAIRFKFASGNMNGTIKMYGVS